MRLVVATLAFWVLLAGPSMALVLPEPPRLDLAWGAGSGGDKAPTVATLAHLETMGTFAGLGVTVGAGGLGGALGAFVGGLSCLSGPGECVIVAGLLGAAGLGVGAYLALDWTSGLLARWAREEGLRLTSGHLVRSMLYACVGGAFFALLGARIGHGRWGEWRGGAAVGFGVGWLISAPVVLANSALELPTQLPAPAAGAAADAGHGGPAGLASLSVPLVAGAF